VAVQISLAAWPGLRHEQAAKLAVEGARAGTLAEPQLGVLAADDIQLVPQSFGQLTESFVEDLRAAYPTTRFRLHANVRVLTSHRLADLSGFLQHREWFEQSARISRLLGATAYSAHTGMRSEATLPEVVDNAKRCAEMFGCVVAIEGQYPTKGDRLLVSSWDEYRTLFESGAALALDLSHVNILARQSGRIEMSLIAEMLASEQCIEVHCSTNDGVGDTHQTSDESTWWTPLLKNIHPKAVVFTEGNHRRRANQTQGAIQ